MHTKVLISKEKGDEIRAIVLRSHHNLSKRRSRIKPGARKESEFGSKAYRDACQRAFNRFKAQVYFNPDMKFFVTLTYAGIQDDYTQVMHDIKMLVKAEKRRGHNLKYGYVLEWQDRGSLHVHMITNAELTTHINKNGYKSLTYWKHGFTSMLSIRDFDSNFKPYLYMFKYMRKAQRIGKTFIHTSRNLNNFKTENRKLNLLDWTTITQEYTQTQIVNKNGQIKTLKFYRNYLKYDMMQSRKVKINEYRGYLKWQKVLLHSTKEKAKFQVNHLQH